MASVVQKRVGCVRAWWGFEVSGGQHSRVHVYGIPRDMCIYMYCATQVDNCTYVITICIYQHTSNDPTL